MIGMIRGVAKGGPQFFAPPSKMLLNFNTKYSSVIIIIIVYLAAMTYNQVHYFRVNHLADSTQNGHTKIPVG